MNDDQKKLCMEDLAAEHVKTRDGGGFTLSYIDGFYVKSKLLEFFGPGGWKYNIQRLEKVCETMDEKGRHVIGYMAVVQLSIDGWMSEDVGNGTGIDASASRAHESACKEAVTDSLKRVACSLGYSLGLALYDKDKTHVDGEVDSTPPAKQGGGHSLPKCPRCGKDLFGKVDGERYCWKKKEGCGYSQDKDPEYGKDAVPGEAPTNGFSETAWVDWLGNQSEPEVFQAALVKVKESKTHSSEERQTARSLALGRIESLIANEPHQDVLDVWSIAVEQYHSSKLITKEQAGRLGLFVGNRKGELTADGGDTPW